MVPDHRSGRSGSRPERVASGPAGRAGPWLLAALALVPLALVPIFHWLADPARATGFIQYDMAYYLANGREIFEKGFAGAYANPYDPAPGAPVIYFHWLMVVLGCLGRLAADSPGLVFNLLGWASSLVMARITLALVRERLGPESVKPVVVIPAFLLLMWGGGLFALTKVGTNLMQSLPLDWDLTFFMPFRGYWFMNWGLNTLYATEAVYHALMAAAFLAVLRDRWNIVLLMVALIASTHPWTGAQALAVFGGWAAVQTVAARFSRLWCLRLAVLGSVALAFGGYYFWFLPGHPSHQILSRFWSLKWAPEAADLVLAYGPAGLLACMAAAQAWRRRGSAPAEWQQTAFLLFAAGVSFLLANHHWFVAPRQPLHFTRGYIWLPLMLTALPAMVRYFRSLRERARLKAGGVLALAGALAVLDTGAFIREYQVSATTSGVYLDPDVRALFRQADQARLSGLLLCDEPLACYLAAVYTGLQPWAGHWANTPDYKGRLRAAEAYLAAWSDSAAGSEASEGRAADYSDLHPDWILATRTGTRPPAERFRPHAQAGGVILYQAR